MVKKDRRGFTILEIAIVIILMGIIGVIAAPSVGLIRKQEVKKLAKEMCLDLTAQRIKAMSMGTNHYVELTDEDTLGHNYDYKLLFKNQTTSNKEEIEKTNRSNSKNIDITMGIPDATGAIITPLQSIQFDSYGEMLDTALLLISKITITIKYDDAKAKIDFDGITGNYTIY